MDHVCSLQDEYQLDMYQLYSQSGCIFECKMRIGRAKTRGGCTPWFYPTRGKSVVMTRPPSTSSLLLIYIMLDTNMCDPWQTQIFLSAIMDGGAGSRNISSNLIYKWMLTLVLREILWSLFARLCEHYLQSVCQRHAPQEVWRQEYWTDDAL